jgi:hypothetical protein
MKQIVAGLIIFLSTCFGSRAQTNDSVPHCYITVATFNDSWAGGFTHIYDDYRSYGTELRVEIPRTFLFQCRLSGLTDKGRTLSANRSRLDELSLSAQVILKKDVFGYLDLYGSAGLYDLNKYSGASVQNVTHATFGVDTLVLPYSSMRGTFPEAGTSIITHPLKLRSYGSHGLYVQPEMEAFFVPGYFASFRPKIPLKWLSQRGDYFAFYIGYQYSPVISTNALLKTITQAESGTTLEYSLRAGMFFINWKIYPQHNYSVGTYGLNIRLGGKKITFTNRDISFESGATTIKNGYYLKYIWGLKNKSPLQFALYHQFGTFLKKNLTDYPKTNGHYLHLSAGLETNFFEHTERFAVIPYGGLHLGFMRQQVYSGLEKSTAQQTLSPIVMGETGIKIRPPKKFFHRNSRWGVSMNCKYVYAFEHDNTSFSALTRNLPNAYFFWGAGLFADLDL